MDILLDAESLDDSECLTLIHPIASVRMNPTILKAEGKTERVWAMQL